MIDKDALEMVMQTGGEIYKPVIKTHESVRISFPAGGKEKYPLDVTGTMALKALLERAVLESLHGHDEIGLLLSGGVDSSLLLHLVKRVNPDVEVIAYHTDFGVPERSELQDAAVMAYHEGVNLRIIDVHSKRQIPFIEESLLMMKTISYATPSVYMAFDKMRQDGVHVVFNALGLDELMAGYTIHRRYFNRTKLAISPFINMANKPVRYLMHKFGNDKAFMLSNILINPATRLVKDAELDVHAFYKSISAGSLWDTIQHWTYVTMQDNFATLSKRGAWAHGIKLVFPYMDYKLMKYCHDIEPEDKLNKAPIRWLMRNIYNIPEQIVCKGENWDKIGWGGTPLPYFEDADYMSEVSTNRGALENWFTSKAIARYEGSNRVFLQMLLFTKLLEILEC
jgi:asparagine synthetase B (glutamine-hydrolysing)